MRLRDLQSRGRRPMFDDMSGTLQTGQYGENDGPRITALLGPTNTGKTHFAIERLLAHDSGMIGFPLRLLARENYERVVAAKGRDKGRAGYGRRENCARGRALFPLHGRIDAARPAGRLSRCGRGATRCRPGSRPCLHRADAFRPRDPGNHVHGRSDHRQVVAPTRARGRDHHPAADVEALVCRREEDHASAAPERHRRVLGGRCLCDRRSDAPPPGRHSGGDGGALAAHPERTGRDVPGRRGGFPGGDRRHRHGAQSQCPARRVLEPGEIRRPPSAPAIARRDCADRGPRRAPRQ